MLPLAVHAQSKTQQLADSVMKYQMKSGGWPKNQDWAKGADQKVMKQCKKTGVGSTIDNGATINELRIIAKACSDSSEGMRLGFSQTDEKLIIEHLKKYRDSFILGLQYLLKMQYENGGWPQYYPARKEAPYSSQITFNDNAIVNVLNFLYEVANDEGDFQSLGINRSLKKECQRAFDRGVKCIVDCQIRVNDKGEVLKFGTEEWQNGIKTVWCQQHDYKTLEPVGARAFELASYTGHGETCEILKLLMERASQTEEVKYAIKGGVEWLEKHAIKDRALKTFMNEDGKKDIRLVEMKGASPLWARYYDLKSEEPMFCDRDGVAKKSISEIGYERRNGYKWFGDGPQKIIDMYYNR